MFNKAMKLSKRYVKIKADVIEFYIQYRHGNNRYLKQITIYKIQILQNNTAPQNK